MLAFLLLTLVRSDVFSHIALERILDDRFRDRLNQDRTGRTAEPSSASLSSISPPTTSSPNQPSTTKKDAPIIIISQESPRDTEPSGTANDEESVIRVVQNAAAENAKAGGSADPDQGSGSRDTVVHKPLKINNMLLSDKRSDEKPYWTTIVVDNKLRKVKLNVKVMTVVETIDSAVGPDTKDGFRFWDRAGQKSETVSTTVSMPPREATKTETSSASIENVSKEASRLRDAASKSLDTASKSREASRLKDVVSRSKEVLKARETASKSAEAVSKSKEVSASAAEKSASVQKESRTKSASVAAVSASKVRAEKSKEISKSAAAASKSRAETSSKTSVSAAKARDEKTTQKPAEKTVAPSVKTASISMPFSSRDRKSPAASAGKDVGSSRPELDDLFYVLRNMPAKRTNNGKVLVEGNFSIPEEDKLKNRKFRFSGYIQTA